MRPKKQTNYSEQYGTVRLHLNDLDKIIHLAEDNGIQVQFEDEDFEYDDLSELKSRKGDYCTDLILNFNVDTQNPYSDDGLSYFQLEIESDLVRIQAHGEPTSEQHYLLNEVKTLLESNILRLGGTRRLPAFVVFGTAFCLPVLISIAFLTVRTLPVSIAIVVNGLSGILVGWVSFHVADRLDFAASKVYFIGEHEKKGFFYRNKDRIAVGVIVAIVTVLFTLGSQQLMEWLNSSI